MRGRVAFLDRAQDHKNKPRKCVRSSGRLEFRILSVGWRKFLPCCRPLVHQPISVRRGPRSGAGGTRPEVGAGRVGAGRVGAGRVGVGVGRVGVGRVGDRGPVPLVGAGRVGVAGRDAGHRSGPARLEAIENPGRNGAIRPGFGGQVHPAAGGAIRCQQPAP